MLLIVVFYPSIFAISSSEENLCPICYEKLNLAENYTSTLPCSHNLCTKCWLICAMDGMKKCPMCRNPRLLDLLTLIQNSTSFIKIFHEQNFSLEQISNFALNCAIFGNLNFCQNLFENYDLKKIDNKGQFGLMQRIFDFTPKEKQLPILKYLVYQNQINLYAQSDYGTTFLHDAAYFGRLEVIQYLLTFDFLDVDDQDFLGNTPLMHAIKNVNKNEDEILETITYLISEHFADPDIASLEPSNPLSIALQKGYFKIIKYLLENTTDFISLEEHGGQQCFLLTTLLRSTDIDEHKKQRILAYLITKQNFKPEKCKIEGQYLTHICVQQSIYGVLDFLLTFIDVDEVDSLGNTVLLQTIAHENDIYLRFEIVKFLIQVNNADINCANLNDMTPLLSAILQGDIKIAFFLLEQKNIDVNQLDSKGNNVLMTLVGDIYFFEFHTLRIVKALVEKNINITQKNKSGSNALHISAYCGYNRVTKYFVENTNIDLHELDFDGNNILFYVITSFNLSPILKIDSIKYLLQKGVNVNVPNGDGSTILHATLGLGFLDIAKFFLDETTINPNALDNRGETPLQAMITSNTHRLTESEKLTMLVILGHNYNATFNSVNLKGETILHLAADQGYLEILQYLLVLEKLDVNQQDFQGNSILMHVLQTDSFDATKKYEIIHYLIQTHGADANLKNFEGVTPVLESLHRGLFYIFYDFLLHSNADLQEHGDLVLNLIVRSENLDPSRKLRLLFYLFENRNVRPKFEEEYDFATMNITDKD